MKRFVSSPNNPPSSVAGDFHGATGSIMPHLVDSGPISQDLYPQNYVPDYLAAYRKDEPVELPRGWNIDPVSKWFIRIILALAVLVVLRNVGLHAGWWN